MQKTSTSLKSARNDAFSSLSDMAHAMAAPVRLRIIQVLSNRPLGVEDLSHRIEESIANTSQHLQKLKKAGMVVDLKDGVQRTYSIKSPAITEALLQFQKIAFQVLPQARTAEEELCPSDLRSENSLETILKDVRDKKAILIDVRDQEEFDASPAPLAVFFPRDEIKKNLDLLSKRKAIYAFCRGRYCYLANDVVRDLRKQGYKAYRLPEMSYEIKKALESEE